MKKSILTILLGFFLTTCYVKAENSIAIVDLQKIVSNSNQVKQLKQELNKIIINARGEIANESDNNKIINIEEKYTREFNAKKTMLEKEYNTKLAEIENNIKNEIAKKAKKDDYDYVFAKSVVLYGGKDITDEIHVK